MSLFKLRDKVIFGLRTNDTSLSRNRIGEKGIVVRVTNDNYGLIKFPDGDTCLVYWKDLDIVEPRQAKSQTKYKCFMCDREGIDNKDILNIDEVEDQHEVPLCEEHYNKAFNYNINSLDLKPRGSIDEKGIIKSNRTFGVELESYTRTRINEMVCYLLCDKGFGGGSDCSIHPPSGWQAAVEFRTSPLRGLVGENLLIETCDTMQKLGFGVNDSCGTHCHIGVPEYTKGTKKAQERLRLLVLMYTIFDPCIRCLLPQIRRNGRFCEAFSVLGFADLEQATKKPCGKFAKEKYFNKLGKRFSKYNGINFSSLTDYGTIEIRYHEGSIDAPRLIHWIALHTAIIDLVMDGDITEKQILSFGKYDDVKELLNGLLEILTDRLDPLTVAYTKARFEEYKDINHKDDFIKQVKTVTKEQAERNYEGNCCFVCDNTYCDCNEEDYSD